MQVTTIHKRYYIQLAAHGGNIKEEAPQTGANTHNLLEIIVTIYTVITHGCTYSQQHKYIAKYRYAYTQRLKHTHKLHTEIGT